MDIKALKTHAAKLEMRVDFLETQFCRLNEMLVSFGFEEGIKTLSSTLDEVMQMEDILRNE